jgi:DNA-binding response OmpR family regulator
MAKGYKILVIDDEEDLRENLKYVFESEGYIVQLAEDGVKGLKMLESFSPDLIILDLNMPNMGGIEFYQKICVQDVPRFPVFVLTARANMEKLFKDFNVDGFMAKPFGITELTREVGYVIDKKSIKGGFSETAGPKKIFIVENDNTFSGTMGIALLNRGFSVNLAKSGSEAIERISKDVPDVICVKMDLPDMAGDVVIQKLKRMAKTSGIRTILYSTAKIQAKESIDKLVMVSSEINLLEAIDDILKDYGQ